MNLQSVSVYNKEFQRVAVLDSLVSYTVKEQSKSTGDFTLWVQATVENMTALQKDHVVEFNFEYGDTEQPLPINQIMNGDTVYAVNNPIDYDQLVNLHGYKVSGDADRILNGQTVTLSLEMTAQGASVGLQGLVGVVLPYTKNNIASQLAIDMTAYVGTNGTNRYHVTYDLGEGVLVFGDVQVYLQDVLGSVSISKLMLTVGTDSSSFYPALEDDMSIKHPNTVWGLIIARDVKKDAGFNGLEVKGKLLEDFMRWRCIWGRYFNSGTVPAIVNDVISTNFITCSMPERCVSWVELDNSTPSSGVSVTVEKAGGYVSELVYGLLSVDNIGIKAIYDKRHQKVRVYMFRGKDRSTQQSSIPYVVFSDENGLLVDPNYTEDSSNHKNVALVYGDIGAKEVRVAVGTATGADRREISVAAPASSTKKADNTPITVDEFKGILTQLGAEKLMGYDEVKSLSSKVHSQAYVYGKDYTIGDTVSIIYGIIGVAYHAPIETVVRSGAGAEESIELSFGRGVLTVSDKLKLRLN